MSKLQFTKEQQQAVDTLDKSILVAAAAGSGKTAVLIQRIVNIVLQGKANVDELLIVTFTNAAASEMKLKLSKEIRRRMQENPESRAMLGEQINRLYKAYITTFSSFSIRIIKEFFHKIDTEPNFRICDEVKAAMLQNQAIDELFEAGFEDDDFVEGCSFREFMRLYSREREEDSLKVEMLNAYAKLRSMPDYFEWAHERAKELKLEEQDFAVSDLEKFIRTMCIADLKDMLALMYEAKELCINAGLVKMHEEKLQQEIDAVEGILETLEEHCVDDVIARRIGDISFARMNLKKEYKENYEEIKEDVKALRENYKKIYTNLNSSFFVPDLSTRIAEMNATYKYTEYYINLLEAFEKRYLALKKEEGVIDFSDADHMAAEILKDEDAAQTLRDRLKYIFIDEYQDTNNIQEALIQRISRPDNVFKVGDVKQSIYRFRQAEPAIFKRTYEDYSDEDNEDAITIDLNTNFRCNPASVRFINSVFETIMEGYDEAASLHVGVKDCPEEYDFMPEVHLLVDHGLSGDAEDEEPEESFGEDFDEGAATDEADEEIKDLSVMEAEAEYVARMVGDLLGTEFYDTDAKLVRTVQAKDIVILLRSVKYKGEIFAQALRSLDVQSHIEEVSDYFSTVEIKVAQSLLMTIDNFKRDVPLIASLHSEAFGFNAAELAEIRAAHKAELESRGESSFKVPYWTAVQWYADNGSDAALREKLNATIETFEEWKAMSTMMPLADFIWKILSDSKYYLYAGAMYDGSRRQANLNTLVDRAADFAKDSIVSLNDFIRYLEVMQGKKLKNSQASMVGKEDNVVRIQTIHKSKGLEYPFVIIAGLGTDLKKDTIGKGLIFDMDLGIGLSYISPDKKFWRSTILQKIIHEKSLSENLEEELRILYVAMTRVRNKLMLVGSVKEAEKESILKGEYSDRSFMRILGRKVQSSACRYISPDLVRNGNWGKESRTEEIIKACMPGESGASPDEAMLADAARRLEFSYPDEKLKLKAKYSVSELRVAKNLEENASAEKLPAIVKPEVKRLPVELDMSEADAATADDEVVAIMRNTNNQKRRAKSTDIGIAYHRIMEFLDFSKCLRENGKADTDYIHESAEYLLEKGAVDESAYKQVKLENIAGFFESALGKRAVAASERGSLRKEKPFTLVKQKDGHSVLVQGVIDCLFEEDGEYVLIDYKSSFLRPGFARDMELLKIKKEYKVQVELYREAIEQGTSKKVKESYLYLFLSGDALRIDADASDGACARLERICSRLGMSELENGNLSGNPDESRKLIDALSPVLSEEFGIEIESEYGPAPDNDVWRWLSDIVRTAFPTGLGRAKDKRLAKQVHQLRYVISAQQAEYVRAVYPAATDEESLAQYFATIDGEWSSEESDRLHNKRQGDAYHNPLKIEPNIKLVCENFHSEFILSPEGKLLNILDPEGGVEDIVNGASFNYARGNDLWLDGAENPLSIHGLLDVHISKVDPPFRRAEMKLWTSPSLVEYKLGGIWLASQARKKKFAAKVKMYMQ